MGTSSALRSKTHLEKNEIFKISTKNNYINSAFARTKNEDGYLTIKELNIITNGLINEKTLKKIIQICGSKKDKLTYDDFCYFYALINTSSFEPKLNFLLDFIFIKKDKLTKEKYIHKVNKYFSDSEFLIKIFLDENLIKNSSIFSRDDVYSFIEKNYKNDLNEYSLYINNKNINDKDNSGNNNIKVEINEINDNNDNTVVAMSNSRENINNTVDSNSVNVVPIKNEKYESLSFEFRNIEKSNNGIFPISKFQDMLRELNINEPIIDIIGNYLTIKTKKSFFNFELFKEILSLLISEENNQNKNNKEMCKGLFTLISYPNNYIEKSSLLNYYQNDKDIKEKLEKFGLGNHIDLYQFLEINKKTEYLFIDTLENLKYLKYIFFKETSEDRSIEFQCIETLIKEESMEDYILERLQYDSAFYLIDIDFWNKWNKIVTKFDKERNFNDFRKLRMNTRNFTDRIGNILEDKEYLEDYVILSETIYNLFYNWYGPPLGKTIVRYKIYLDEDSNNSYLENDKQNNKLKKIFSGVERKTGKKFELELNPVFLQFFMFLELIKNNNNSMSEMKTSLKKMFNRGDEGDYNCFSRKKKFLDIAKMYNNNIDVNNLRFWVYSKDKFEKVGLNNSLEELGIENRGIVLIEEKLNNNWPSEKIKKDNYKMREREEEIFPTGLYNIGNTCYMNSVLQIFLNIEQIRDIFIYENDDENNQFLSFILNTENKEVNNIVQNCGYLIVELINLLREKWLKRKKNLTPRKFKDICGEYNNIFKSFEQQDAHDFYTFLVDKLHEETNIKTNDDNSKKENSDTVDTNDLDLGNEYWANDVRNNASYFYALFMGQLKSTLICSECETQKIKFEPFSALEVPIPEGNNIIIEILLFRLPYSLRKFNLERYKEDDDDNDDEEEDDGEIDVAFSAVTNRSGESIKIRNTSKKKIKKEKTEKSFINNIVNNNNKNKDSEINNLLNLNIPLRLKIEVSRKEKCSLIIDKLKCMSDINIEKNFNYTELIMISRGKYIDEDLIINETFDNLNTVCIYEILNLKGIINIFNYEELEKTKILSLKNQEVNNNLENEKIYKRLSTIKTKNKNNKVIENKQLNIPSFYFSINESNKKVSEKKYDSYEILVPIVQRIKSDLIKGFIPLNSYQYFYKFQDFIILSSKNSIKPYNLYEMMWKKYMYFLNCPSNYDNKTWWKSKREERKNLPFIITIINKDTASCASCPWFRFCTGCILDPFIPDYININSNSVIVIEWDKDVYNQEINKNNFSLIMNHTSVNNISDISKTNIDKISIDDCLNLFTKSEEMKDIQCEKCKKKTLFKKTLQIEKLPSYLVIVLKRFKYILTNSVKIQNLITFPLDELNMQNYVTQKNINYKYHLFGVINHSGSLEGGHYYSLFNINGTWLKYDDSSVYEISGGIVSNKAYMLIYQSMKHDKKDKNLNFLGIMERAFKLYKSPRRKFEHLFNYIFDGDDNIKSEYLKNCDFYYGEPVTIDGKSGYIVKITKEKDKNNNYVNIRIKLKKGFFVGTVSIDSIERETIKRKVNMNLDLLLNYGKENINQINRKRNKMEDAVICGSSVCIIY